MDDNGASALPPEEPHTIPDTDLKSGADPVYDLLVVGAGPTGLACAIDAQKAGFARCWWTKDACATHSFTIRRT